MAGHTKAKRQTNRLSAAHIRSPKPGRHHDGHGLFLEVEPSGAARWIQRIMVRGRRRDIGLGSLALVSLAGARDEALANRKLARAGGDPVAARRARLAANLAPTFENAAEQCYAARAGTWRNPKHKAQWLSTMKAYVYPRIGSKQVNEITVTDVLEALTPIWNGKPETARRVRQRIGLVLDWAKAKGWREAGSPTREIGKALPAHSHIKRHQKAMPFVEVPDFLKRLAETGATASTKAAMEVLILTASRTSEVLGARWSEVDLDRAIWTVPGERMKAKRPHAVPLSVRALELFKEMLAAHSGKGDLVFQSKPGMPLSAGTLLRVMQRMNSIDVPHGFRSSFRDFAAERTNAPREVAEAALAHTLSDKVEAAYRRSDLFDKRRRLMAAWAAFCAGGGTVVRLAARS
jgi:integrase